MAAQRPQLSALTGIRFFAALHVVLFHFGLSVADAGPKPLRILLGTGYSAVSLFFVLSGFVLAYAYFEDGDEPARFQKKAFWIARLARIYPVYLIGFILAAPSTVSRLWAEDQMESLPQAAGLAALALSLLQAWAPQTATSWNVPSWSLSVEAFFYFVFPFVADRLSLGQTKRQLMFKLVLLWLLALAAPIIYVTTQGNSASLRSIEAPDAPTAWMEFVMYSPMMRLPEFLFGTILGRLFIRGDLRLGASWGIGAALAILAALAFLPMVPHLLVHNGVFVPFFAVLIVSLAGGDGSLARFLSLPFLLLLGEASYALYLLHFHARPWILRALSIVAPDASHNPTLTLVVYVTAIVAISVLVFQYIEVPARRMIKGALSGKLHHRQS